MKIQETDIKIQKATVADVPAIMALLEKRIRWMDEKKLYQWNKTDYFGVYPYAYFVKRVEEGVVFVAATGETIVGVMALLTEDPRWPEPAPALYVHHLATDPAVPGLGAQMLTFAEEYSRLSGGDRLRLDCQTVNPALNRYYEKLGYVHAGSCVDGAYEGNLMEKYLCERK